MRPDIGTQDKFRKKKAPATYRYDSSLSPALDWDGQHGARELGEWLLARISEAAVLLAPHRFPAPQQFTGANGTVLATVHSLQDAVEQLKRLGAPVPHVDRQGRATLVRCADDAALRARAALDAGHRGNAHRA